MKTNAEYGKLILFRREGRVLSLFIKDNRLLSAAASREQPYQVGDIVIGRVANVVPNIQAAFVELGGGNLCFLPLQGIQGALMTNRTFDGRILAGDELVVQLTREAVKTKDPVADTRLSFTGKYAVVTVPGMKISYSGKLDVKERQRLGAVLEKSRMIEKLAGFGLIVRTNAAGLQEKSLLIHEIEGLLQKAQELVEKADSRTCYSVLRKAPPAYLAGLRDRYQETFDKIITDDRELYEEIRQYLSEHQPEDLAKLSFYEDSRISLNSLYGLESKLTQALSRQVWLSCGGYLVIEPTEALTVIDVNSGKFNGRKDSEETFYYINREACEEIAVQLTLRNLSGMILVDFINMKEEENRREILRYLTVLLKKDPIQTTVVDMTPLGLVEITRKKINKTLAEQMKS